MKTLILTFTFTLIGLMLYSQSIEYSLETRSLHSDYIVEAKVIEQFSYKVDDDVFTANKLEICSVIYEPSQSFLEPDEIFAITYGGKIANEIQQYDHVLDLNTGDEGIFFLNLETYEVPFDKNSDQLFYHFLGGSNGFVNLKYDTNFDLDVYDGNINYNSMAYILDSISYYLNLNPLNSCILDSKSGIVLYADELNYKNDTVYSNLRLKGMYSKSYDLERTIIELNLGDFVDLSQYGLYIKPKSQIIKNNYSYSWNQPALNKLRIEVLRDTTNSISFKANSNIKEYLEIGFNQNALNLNFENLLVSQARFFNTNSSGVDFEEIYFEIEDGLIENKPYIHHFTPEIVAAGLTQNEAEGSNYKGYIEIHGNNFGNIPTSELENEIPWNYSVRFVRDNGDVFKENLKVTPPASEYEFWTDTLIRVKVPTFGYLVDNEEQVEQGDTLKRGVAITGEVHVQRGDMSDDDTPAGQEGTLKVAFSIFNVNNPAQQNEIQIPKIPDYHNASNGAYQFVIDSSFHNNINLGESSEAFEQKIVEAFCEWNELSQLKVEIVDECSSTNSDYPCCIIRCEPHKTNSKAVTGSVDLVNFAYCNPELVVGQMVFTFHYGSQPNGDIPFYWSSEPTTADDSLYIYDTALHEIGHILQLGHVREDTSIMYPAVNGYKKLDSAAKDASLHMKSKSSNSPKCPAKVGMLQSCLTSIFEFNETNNFLIYPTISSNGKYFIESENRINQIHIFDNVGRLVFAIEHPHKLYPIDINVLQKGIYFVKVYFNQSYAISKIIKL